MFSHNGLEISWLKHSGFKIKTPEGVMYFDPYQVSGEPEKADIVFLTHTHYDHYDEPSLKLILKEETQVFCSIDCKEALIKWAKVASIHSMGPNEELVFGHLKIQTTPAYNLDKPFHPKEKKWLGFLIEVENTRLFYAGDTDALSELEHIQCDIGFFPISGIYVMDPKQAASLANKIAPKVVSFPMHWGTIVDDQNRKVGTLEDAKRFCELCQCPTKILEPTA